MCLLTNQQKPKIAQKDIVAYKIFRKITKPKSIIAILSNYPVETLLSWQQNFVWLRGKTYTTELKRHKSDSFIPLDNEAAEAYLKKSEKESKISYHKSNLKWSRTKSISEGFHAALNEDRLTHFRLTHFFETGYGIELVLYKVIIPRGSEYYIDKTGLIVSNKMRLL